MLASIHPLGERGRNQRWAITVSAYLAGSLTGAALIGTALGQAGAWLGLPGGPGPVLVGVATLAFAVAGLVLDLRIGGARTPTVHRQVDEDWLRRYRGWVYGVSFGFQLGLGVVTVVNSFTVYLALALALLSGSPASGLVIGATFGLVRGASLLLVAGVREPQDLRARLQRLQALEPASHRLAVAVQALVAVTGLALIGR